MIKCLFLVWLSTQGFAVGGLFFNVVTEGSTLTLTTNIPNHTYLNAGIRLLSNNVQLAFPGIDCTPYPSGYCLFSVSNTMPKMLTITGQSGPVSMILCLNGKGPLSCQHYDFNDGFIERLAYVTNLVGVTNLCAINSTTGEFTSCAPMPSGPAASYAIVLAKNGLFAYISGGGAPDSGVRACSINPTTGVLSGCTSLAQVSAIDITALGMSPIGAYLYTQATGGNAYKVCSLNATTGLINSCAETGTGGFQMAFTRFGTAVYYAKAGEIVRCSVDLLSGVFSACASVYTVLDVGAIAVALSSDNRFLYYGDAVSNNVFKCNVDGSTGGVTGCVAESSGFGAYSNLVVNAAGTYLYYGSSSTTVTKCAINPSTGVLSGCAATGSGFISSAWVALR